MTDPITIVITVIITVLVILLTIIGIEIFRVLKKLEKTLEKLDSILGDVEKASNAISEPVSKIGGIFSSITSGAGVITFASKILEKALSKKTDEK